MPLSGSWSTPAERASGKFLANQSGLVNFGPDRPDRESGPSRPHWLGLRMLAASRGRAHIPSNRSGFDRTGWKRRSKAARLREAPGFGTARRTAIRFRGEFERLSHAAID